jgi:hypothetical protein
MRLVLLLLLVLSVSLVAPVAALATTTFTFSTSDNPFDPAGSRSAVANQGWWADVLANHDDNENYFVGIGLLHQMDHRAFFTFDLASLPAAPVVSATLRLTRFNSSSANEATETLAFFDVSTDAATLNQNDRLDLGVFADLGSGKSYGAFDVPGVGPGTDVFEFALGAAALADLQAAAGGWFSIGAMLASDDGSDALFISSSSYDSIQQLVVVIPEPFTGALLLVGLLGLARFGPSRGNRQEPRSGRGQPTA